MKLALFKKMPTSLLKDPTLLMRGKFSLIWMFKRVLAELKLETEKVEEAKFVTLLLNPEGADLWNEAQEAPWPLLYVIARIMKPKVVVETGVQERRSSASFLWAMERNNFGTLYSIEFVRHLVS